MAEINRKLAGRIYEEFTNPFLTLKYNVAVFRGDW